MRWVWLLGLLPLLAACSENPPSSSEQASATPTPLPDVTPTPMKMPDADLGFTMATPSPTPIDLPIPVGQRAYDIRIPDYDDIGNLISLVEVGEIVRLEDDRAKVSRVEIELLDGEGNTEFEVELPESYFDLNARILTSDQPAQIRNDDIEITGSSFRFDADNRSIVMEGQVYMAIKNLGSLLEQAEATSEDE